MKNSVNKPKKDKNYYIEMVIALSEISTSVIRTSAMHKPRIHTMDELRGFAVLCMIFYHAFYTMAFLLNVELGKQLLYFFMPAEPYFAGMFILISGVSSQLSHSNLSRGLKLLGVALAVSLVTCLLLPDEAIRFGILHMLAVSMILFGLLQRALERVPFWLGFVLTALLFACTYQIGRIGFGWPGLFSLPLPQTSFWMQFLYPNYSLERLYSADYFPLLPWIFLFFCGTFLGRFAREGRFPRFLYRSRAPFLSWMGRHALILYIVHQPVIYGLGLGLQWLMTQLHG